jgi:hypothetical protein
VSRAGLVLVSVASLAGFAGVTACVPREPPVQTPPPASAIAVGPKPLRPLNPLNRGPLVARTDPRDTRDTNPPGTTLRLESVFVDPSPPEDWKQCAGFVNTEDDDVTADFLDNCLYADRLRVRVFDAGGALEEDVYVTGMSDLVTWPQNYLGTRSTVIKATHWGVKGGVPSVLTSNLSECYAEQWPKGTTLGSGHATTAIISPAADGYDEYRISCGVKQGLPDRKIAVYR